MLQDNKKEAPAAPDVLLKGHWFLDDWFFGYVYQIGFYARKYSREALRFKLQPRDSAAFNADLIAHEYAEEKRFNPSAPSILRALLKAYGKSYALIGFYKFFWAIFTWASAWYFLKAFLLYIQNAEPEFNGHMWAVALLLGSILSSICIHQLYAECNRVGVQVRAAICSIVYRKSLKLSRVRGGAGEVINILSTDLQRVVDCVSTAHFLWGAFLECTIIIILSFVEVSISAIPALGFIILLLPVQIYLGKLTSAANREQTDTTTERVHIMSEILTAIKLIKFYAWERPFRNKIDKIREHEVDTIYRVMMIKTVNFAIVFAIPVLIALCSLAMYTGLGNALLASTVFAVLSVYNTLRYPFFMLPMAVKGYASAMTAMKRLDRFLGLDEVEELKISPKSDKDPDLAFEIKDGDFKWDGVDATLPTISDINLSAKRGEKIAIIGDVGSGKSSLLAALLGQIRKQKGDMKIYGKTAYVPQEAWLLNTTLRDNVLFGLEYDKVKYNEVIRVCGLQRDLTVLLAGDMTEIAERGANLSGGQRQRVSVARAVYHNEVDIVLMDDPLSAVDQHVGSHIFQECICQHLKGKTLVIVLHQLQYLSSFDKICMMHEGKIIKQGTYDELLKFKEFKELIERHVDGGEVEDDVDDEPEVLNDPKYDAQESSESLPMVKVVSAAMTPDTEHINQLTVRKPETIVENTITSIIDRNQLSIVRGSHGDVSKAVEDNEMSVLNMDNGDIVPPQNSGKLITEDKSASFGFVECLNVYARAYNGAFLFALACIYFFVVHAVRIGSDYWLRLWVPRTGGFSDAVYLGVYGICTAVFALGCFSRGYFLSVLNVKKSHFLHSQLFHSITRAPMSFFDSTPVGRILSAFSKHQLHADDTLPDAMFQFLQYCPLAMGALVLCAIIVPYNVYPILGIVGIAATIVYFSSPAEDKTKQLDALTKSPIFAHLTCTLDGLFSIRAYHAQERFDSMNLEVLDANHEKLLAMYMVKSWIALNLDLLASIVVYTTAVLIVVNSAIPDRAATAGLALSNALQMLVFVQWTVRQLGEILSQMSSIGQLHYYGTEVQPEPPAVNDFDPGKDWPSNGLIEFKNVHLKYTPNGVMVLKNINMKIYPTEKIGIVGRSGCGKSTLLVSFLRIVDACDGEITIDGVDIFKLGLELLRSKIAIIPQEPVLFKGTVRSNLDPFNKATDEEIWKALESVYLKSKIEQMAGKLDAEVIENGKNFSLGQRQLFCIARAVIAKSKVLVLDEATANVSPETDLLIQKAIRENFRELTVLTIAHRLNTIIDSHRVLVMDAGKIAEFDVPWNLLQHEGPFKSLVDRTGPATAKRLYDLAKEAKKDNAYMELYYKNSEPSKGGGLDIKQFATGKM